MVDMAEEVIDLGKDEDGVYRMDSVSRTRRYPQSISPHLPRHTRIPAFYGFVDGFMYGVEALEQMIRALRRLR